MSRFNFGSRKNDGSSAHDRLDREVYFNRPSARPEEEHYQDDYSSADPRLNREHEREDYRQHPPHQQDHPYFKGQSENVSRNQIGTRQDFQHLRAYGNKSSHPDELKGLSFWKDEEDDLQDDPENWSDRSSPLKFVIAISGIVVVSAIAWFTYRWISQSGNNTPPLIQAEQGPYKVRPENPGGIAIPHQDKLIYGRLSGESDQPVERLLPPPEQPVVMGPPPYPYQQGTPQGQPYPDQAMPQAGGYPQQQYEQAAPNYQEQPQAPIGQPYVQGQAPVYQYPPQQPGQPMDQQQTYREPYPTHQGQPYPNPGYLQQQPQQGPNIYPPAQPPMQMQQGIPQQAYRNYGNAPTAPSQPVAAPPQMRNAGIPSHRPTEPQKGSMVHPSLKEATPNKATLNETTAASLPAQGSAFFVQLATLPTEQLAKHEADRLSRRYKQDLVGNEITVRLVEKADGTKTYRVIAGPFKTRNIALAKSNKFGSGSRVMQLQNNFEG